MNKQEAILTMNDFGKNGKPFFFLINFDLTNCLILNSNEAFNRNILFNFNSLYHNYDCKTDNTQFIGIEKSPVQLDEYSKAFQLVQKHLSLGNSYLVNLTFPTPVALEVSLKTVFHSTQAKYRIFFQDEFVVFSPETFVKINNGKISTYPMKGTIDGNIDNASQLIMNNKKELAEHATIVDLLRNDLSRIAKNVQVEKFRYIEEIKSANKSLLQVSSEISGDLPQNFKENLGNILFELLPAGSISGAPKQKTLEIIREAESYDRGFYCGIAGYFDGENLDSCVLIRFIEKINGNFFYKSGGGITSQSVLKEEYQELIDKIYVPFS